MCDPSVLSHRKSYVILKKFWNLSRQQTQIQNAILFVQLTIHVWHSLRQCISHWWMLKRQPCENKEHFVPFAIFAAFESSNQFVTKSSKEQKNGNKEEKRKKIINCTFLSHFLKQFSSFVSCYWCSNGLFHICFIDGCHFFY